MSTLFWISCVGMAGTFWCYCMNLYGLFMLLQCCEMNAFAT